MTATPYPGPTVPCTDRREYYVTTLDYMRETAIEKVRALPEGEQSTSSLASSWTPLSLLKHLTFVEMRWLEWGFAGASVDAPFADRVDGRFDAGPDETIEVLERALRARGEITRRILGSHDLDAVGAPSERWEGEPPPTLERIAQHLVYEYARHLGHLDIVAEIAVGVTGESSASGTFSTLR